MKKFISNKLLIIFILFTASNVVNAEYRVYQYFVKSRLNSKRNNNAHLIISTLDPVSYLSYHGGSSSIRIDLVRTWFCPGFTGMFKDVCDGPLEALKKRQDSFESI